MSDTYFHTVIGIDYIHEAAQCSLWSRKLLEEVRELSSAINEPYNMRIYWEGMQSMRTLGKDSNLGLPHILGLFQTHKKPTKQNASDRISQATTVKYS